MTKYVVKSGLTREAARLLENALIYVYTMSALANARHEIAQRKISNFSKGMDRAACLTGISTNKLKELMLRDYK